MNRYKRGMLVKVDDGYTKNVYGRKYGVVNSVKFSDGLPIVSVILPLDNGIRINADIQEDKLTPITIEEVIT